jgi:uncharacterized protein
MKKRQVVIIHGGAAYANDREYLKSLRTDEVDESALGRKERKDWKDTLGEKLGPAYDVLYPEMPNWMNAKYREWKIWFERLSGFFTEPVVLIGHSLGGIFLARYLGENISPKKIRAVFLVAAPHVRKNKQKLTGDFFVPADLSKITRQCGQVFIYHSEDDPMVPFRGNYGRYISALPDAEGMIFKNKRHFNQPTFPELIARLRKLF